MKNLSLPFYVVILTLLGIFSAGVDGLFCYKCLAVDCPDGDPDCEEMRAFIQAELRNLYYFNDYLAPCPALNDTYGWRLMQVNDVRCPEEKQNEATCTLGRMQIVTTRVDSEGKRKEDINHATVLGCANRQLLTLIKSAFNEGKCDLSGRNKTTSVGVFRQLIIEHCRDITKQCYEKDFCIEWEHSAVKPWGDHGKTKHFEFTLIIGILAIVVVVICALLIAGLLRDPPNIPSNLPKSIGDESETVKVLDFRDKDFTSIETESDESNVGNNRRPSVPPPPPPRLNRNLRGSTPV